MTYARSCGATVVGGAVAGSRPITSASAARSTKRTPASTGRLARAALSPTTIRAPESASM